MRFFQKFYKYGLKNQYEIDYIVLGYNDFLYEYELSQKDEKFDDYSLNQAYNQLDDNKIFLHFANAQKRKEEADIKIIEDTKKFAPITLYGYLIHIQDDIKYVLKTWYLIIPLIILFLAWRLIAYPESLKLVISVFKKIFCLIVMQ